MVSSNVAAASSGLAPLAFPHHPLYDSPNLSPSVFASRSLTPYPLPQSYRFIRRPEDDAPDTWEVRLARRYYDRLFREYAIADLSR